MNCSAAVGESEVLRIPAPAGITSDSGPAVTKKWLAAVEEP